MGRLVPATWPSVSPSSACCSSHPWRRPLPWQRRTSSTLHQASPISPRSSLRSKLATSLTISRHLVPSQSSLLPTRPSLHCPRLRWLPCSTLRTSRSLIQSLRTMCFTTPLFAQRICRHPRMSRPSRGRSSTSRRSVRLSQSRTPRSSRQMCLRPTVSCTSSTVCLPHQRRKHRQQHQYRHQHQLPWQRRTSSNLHQASPISPRSSLRSKLATSLTNSRHLVPSQSSLLPTRPSLHCPRLRWLPCSTLRTSRSLIPSLRTMCFTTPLFAQRICRHPRMSRPSRGRSSTSRRSVRLSQSRTPRSSEQMCLRPTVSCTSSTVCSPHPRRKHRQQHQYRHQQHQLARTVRPLSNLHQASPISPRSSLRSPRASLSLHSRPRVPSLSSLLPTLRSLHSPLVC